MLVAQRATNHFRNLTSPVTYLSQHASMPIQSCVDTVEDSDTPGVVIAANTARGTILFNAEPALQTMDQH